MCNLNRLEWLCHPTPWAHTDTNIRIKHLLINTRFYRCCCYLSSMAWRQECYNCLLELRPPQNLLYTQTEKAMFAVTGLWMIRQLSLVPVVFAVHQGEPVNPMATVASVSSRNARHMCSHLANLGGMSECGSYFWKKVVKSFAPPKGGTKTYTRSMLADH